MRPRSLANSSPKQDNSYCCPVHPDMGAGHPTKTTPKESTVSSKLILPLIAGFAICVAGSATARAESTSSDEAASQAMDSQTPPPKKKKSEKEKKHPNKTELDKA